MFDVPVTSKRTNITYLNVHCAICNQDFDPANDAIWNLSLTIHEPENHINGRGSTNLESNISMGDLFGRYDDTEVKLNLILPENETIDYESKLFHISMSAGTEKLLGDLFYDEQSGMWKIKMLNTMMNTSAKIIQTKDVFVKECHIGLVATCAQNWTDQVVMKKCLSYTDVWCEGVTHYRNPFCALCNYATQSGCTVPHVPSTIDVSVTEFSSDFSILLDWSYKERSYEKCPSGKMYDLVKKRCQSSAKKENGKVFYFSLLNYIYRVIHDVLTAV